MTVWLCILVPSALIGWVCAWFSVTWRGTVVAAVIPWSGLLVFLLMSEYVLPYQGGGASLWPVAQLFGGTIAAGIGAASHRISLQFRLRRPPASVSSGDMPSRSSRKQCRHDGLLRLFGAVWIILGLIAFVMATISTVKSDAAYRVQLILFSAVALLALVGGVGAIFRRLWAAYILLTLSWVAALYFFGSALAMALWPLFPDSEARFHPLLFLISSGIAVQGLPFLWMALFMRRCVKVSEVKSEPT
jgi:hypothetical protein